MKLLIHAMMMVFVTLGARAEAADLEPRQLMGGGSWTLTREHRKSLVEIERDQGVRHTDREPARRWSVDAQVRKDRTVGGTVTLILDGNAVAGKLRGKVDGRRVWGDVLDESGEQLATFEGAADADGLRGKFTTVNDDEGEWAWDGPLPQ